ncbi:SDR family oxidoreductase [Rubrivirga sp. S365]|uniref:SDR family oxidoreductase n=1 Tax=Rubrivirga litoralis TaxID=3075598 RepID=A0ABU3BQE9_9BACT|nr:MULTISPECIES: SDR family oxidoreductase [unclassified Rubrivirga]MDT0631494.1 SDR family oxidoreductase [Rubrivirga sp. F394]MDT7855523.1 SDR family oxidoreductase [Rubrivirga sp. S365]
MTANTKLALGGVGAWAAARALRRRRALSFAGRTVVISGGSRGLGLLVARRLVAEGARVALLARTEADLDAALADLGGRGGPLLGAALTGGAAIAVPCDVRDREQVEAAVARVARELGPPSVLLHDAGVIGVGPEAHMAEEDYRRSLDVHFWGGYYLTEALRPHLGDGARIGYVSSVAGRVAAPHLAPYSVGKHALVGYADAVRAELAASGVRVTTITPGLMRTGSHPNAHTKGDHEAEFAWFAAADANPLLSISGDRAADKVVDALRHGDAALTLTLPATLGAALDGVAPGLVGGAAKLAARLLPAPTGPKGDERRTGWESFSDAAPSALTRPADEATDRNNELRGHEPLT